MTTIPWSALKSPLLILLVVSLAAGAGVWWSASTLEQAEAARRSQQQANAAVRDKLHRSNTEKQLIEQYRGAYQTLVARGFVGAENRLAWLEAVQQANRDASLYGLDYSLEPRSIPPLMAHNLPLGQTVMRLRMPLLVEDDLSRFLKALQLRTTSIYRVRSCQLTRATDTPPQALNQPELETECELLWFTLATTGVPS